MKNICKKLFTGSCARLLPALAALMAALFIFPALALGDVLINEVMASNGTYTNGHAYDWVELYNDGGKTVDLSGWYLSDSDKNPLKWSFPKGTKLKSGAYLTVYCTGDAALDKGKNAVFYADFKISASGDTLYLSDASGALRQALALPRQYGCVSYGLPAGGGAYGYFETETQGKKNEKTACVSRASEPVILTPAGFYSGKIVVSASCESGAALYYTLDGSTPTEKSKAFPKDGLTLQKTSVLRVRAFLPGAVSSETLSATYLIGDSSPVPVISLITDKSYLFDKKTGALVRGTGSIPNYDKELEYPVNIEYFDETGAPVINQMGTFTASGHSARQNTQKSIAIYARKAYGEEYFNFNPFFNRDYTRYKSLLLRSTNSDAFATRLRDVVASSLAKGEGLLYQDARCVQVFINGEYWGHYNLREKINKYFVAQFEGVTDENDIDAIDILARTGSDDYVQNGDNADWLALCDFCKKKDLNDADNLAYVEENLDIDSLFTHAAYEIILGNSDFTNVRMYRVPGGKWKYLLFDVEACFKSLGKTPLEYYIKPVSAKIQGFRHEPLNALLAVPQMKAKFLTRVAEILEKHFQWPDVESAFAAWEDPLSQILPRHIARWKNLSLDDWKTNVRAAKYYARVRPLKIPQLLQTAMKLTDEEVQTYFGAVLKLLNETNAAN